MTSDGWFLVFEGVIAVFAVAAFILSLLGLWYTYVSSQPKAEVTLTPGLLSPSMTTVFILTAINKGRVPIALTACGVDVYDHGQKNSSGFFLAPPPLSPRLPFVLEPGRSWAYHIDPGEVLALHGSDKGPVLRAFVNDETGHHWTGKVSREWLDGWA